MATWCPRRTQTENYWAAWLAASDVEPPQQAAADDATFFLEAVGALRRRHDAARQGSRFDSDTAEAPAGSGTGPRVARHVTQPFRAGYEHANEDELPTGQASRGPWAHDSRSTWRGRERKGGGSPAWVLDQRRARAPGASTQAVHGAPRVPLNSQGARCGAGSKFRHSAAWPRALDRIIGYLCAEDWHTPLRPSPLACWAAWGLRLRGREAA